MHFLSNWIRRPGSIFVQEIALNKLEVEHDEDGEEQREERCRVANHVHRRYAVHVLLSTAK